MAQSVSITQAGRKYLQLYNIPVSPTNSFSPPKSTQLPTLISTQQSHSHQLHSLPFRLNKLYKTNIITEARAELNKNIDKIRLQLLQDLGYKNEYTSRRANQLIAKLVNDKSRYLKESKCKCVDVDGCRCRKEDGIGNVVMELSKSKNYLARINYLHCESKSKHENIQKQIERVTSHNKQNLDI